MNQDVDDRKRDAWEKWRNFLKTLKKRTLAAICIYSAVNDVDCLITPAGESIALHNSRDTSEMEPASDGLELGTRVLVASQVEITYLVRYLSTLV